MILIIVVLHLGSQTSNITCTKSPNLNVPHLILHLSLPNPLKPGVELRMKMQLEQCWQVMLQLHLNDVYKVLAPCSITRPRWVKVICLCLQNAPITSWSSQRQVLVPSWAQLPRVTSQRPVQQPVVADTLTSQGIPCDSWHRSLMVDNFDQASSIIPMVSGGWYVERWHQCVSARKT